MIDLRSDTVTKPTKGMLKAMAEAEVGDDVFNEDPSILQLEERSAELFGMESALFCPSGTMTNQIAIKILSRPPGELICDELSHVYQYEGGGISFNSGLSVKLLQGNRGRLNASLLEEAINPDDIHKPISQLISIENTCNKGGGSVYDLKDLEEMASFAKRRQLNYHLDGARIFNALAEADYTAKDVGSLFDTISVCLSKGLGCPVGSVLLGSRERIKEAKRIRKVLGGGMRQAGFLAAAGIYAYDNNIKRLKEDHKRAKEIVTLLSSLNFVSDIMPVETNIVVFKLDVSIDLNEFLIRLKEKGVLAVAFGPGLLRFVTHLDFNDDQLTELTNVMKAL